MPWDPNSEWEVFSHICYIMLSNWYYQQQSNEGPSLTINVQQSHKNRNLKSNHNIHISSTCTFTLTHGTSLGLEVSFNQKKCKLNWMFRKKACIQKCISHPTWFQILWSWQQMYWHTHAIELFRKHEWTITREKPASLIKLQNIFHLNTSEEIASGHIPIEYF